MSHCWLSFVKTFGRRIGPRGAKKRSKIVQLAVQLNVNILTASHPEDHSSPACLPVCQPSPHVTRNAYIFTINQRSLPQKIPSRHKATIKSSFCPMAVFDLCAFGAIRRQLSFRTHTDLCLATDALKVIVRVRTTSCEIGFIGPLKYFTNVTSLKFSYSCFTAPLGDNAIVVFISIPIKTC